MKSTLIKITRWLTLLCSWLTLSPLFLYLARKWKMIGKKVSILLLMISPLMLIAYLIITLCTVYVYFEYIKGNRFADNEVIERITGVPFPELEIIDRGNGTRSINGDYTDWLTLEMEEDLSEKTYHHLDSIIECNNTGWRKENDEYHFYTLWGNGCPAPEGEDEEDNVTFSLPMKKGSKVVTITYGAW